MAARVAALVVFAAAVAVVVGQPDASPWDEWTPACRPFRNQQHCGTCKLQSRRRVDDQVGTSTDVRHCAQRACANNTCGADCTLRPSNTIVGDPGNFCFSHSYGTPQKFALAACDHNPFHVLVECPLGYTYFSRTGFCYKQYGQVNRMQDGEKQCVDDGGHLATIHSRRENNFIADLAAMGVGHNSEEFSIFLGYTYSRGYINTYDNTAVKYFNWRAGHPVAWGAVPGNEQNFVCIKMIGFPLPPENRGKWYLATCIQSSPFVCKRRPL